MTQPRVNEVMALDVLSTDGHLRHGFVVPLEMEGQGGKWYAFTLALPDPHVITYIGSFEKPQPAVDAIMQAEEPRLAKLSEIAEEDADA